MKLEKIIHDLENELNNGKDKEKISSYEEIIAENPENITKTESFFKLPLKNILSVFSKIDFSYIDEEHVVFLTSAVNLLMKYHMNEKKSLMFLQCLNVENLMLSTIEQFQTILECFSCCDFLVKYKELQEENQNLVSIDVDYKLKKTEEENLKLKEQISE